MKKSVLLAVVGLAAGTLASFGQGKIIFSSYTANAGAGATTTIFGTSTLVSGASGYKAQLYYAFGTVSDAVINSSAASITSDVAGTLTALNNTPVTFLTGGGAGYFNGGQLTIPGYASGAVTFEIVAFNGTDWATSTSRGRSGAFTMSSLATGVTPAGNFANMPNFFVATVAPVPEPSTLALAGLGGFGMLMALRRKK